MNERRTKKGIIRVSKQFLRKKALCYGCGEPGHTIANCPKKGSKGLSKGSHFSRAHRERLRFYSARLCIPACGTSELTSWLDLSVSPTVAWLATLVLLDLSTRSSSLLAVMPTMSHSPPVGAGADAGTVSTAVAGCLGGGSKYTWIEMHGRGVG